MVVVGNSLPLFCVGCETCCVLDWLVAAEGGVTVGVAVGVASTNGDTGTGVGTGGLELEGGGGVLGLGGRCS